MSNSSLFHVHFSLSERPWQDRYLRRVLPRATEEFGRFVLRWRRAAGDACGFKEEVGRVGWSRGAASLNTATTGYRVPRVVLVRSIKLQWYSCSGCNAVMDVQDSCDGTSMVVKYSAVVKVL